MEHRLSICGKSILIWSPSGFHESRQKPEGGAGYISLTAEIAAEFREVKEGFEFKQVENHCYSS